MGCHYDCPRGGRWLLTMCQMYMIYSMKCLSSYHNNSDPWKLDDKEWGLLSPILATTRQNSQGGRPRSVDDRRAAEACLFRHYRSLAPNYRAFGWNELPKSIKVSPATANRRFREWSQSGAWVKFWHALQKLRAGRQPLQSVQTLIGELERAYAFFNVHCFESALPMDVLITVERLQKCQGLFRADRNGRGWIAISTRVLNRGAEEPLHTLLHEMVHLRNRVVGLPDCHRGHHNRHFRDTAALVGLDCQSGPHGYAQTVPTRHARKVFARFRALDVFAWPWDQTEKTTTADFPPSHGSRPKRIDS